MIKKSWGHDPYSGGVKVPKTVQERTRSRIITYAEKNFSGKFTRIDVRFRGVLCYIDAYTEPYISEGFDPKDFGETREEYIERLRSLPIHLCRLRYFGDEEKWSMAFFTYSNEKYQPSVFNNGSFHGSSEEAFESSSMYLE